MLSPEAESYLELLVEVSDAPGRAVAIDRATEVLDPPDQARCALVGSHPCEGRTRDITGLVDLALLAEATVYRWKAQDLIDRGLKPGISTSERGELAAARQRIKELETELALVTQAAKLFEEGVRPPKSQVPGHR